MIDTVYLTLDDCGIHKMTKTPPQKVGNRQFITPVTIEVPDSIWEKQDKILDEVYLTPKIETTKRGIMTRAELAVMPNICFGPAIAFETETSYGHTVNHRCAACGFENSRRWDREEPHYIPEEPEEEA